MTAKAIEKPMDKVILFADSNRGQFIPQHFVRALSWPHFKVLDRGCIQNDSVMFEHYCEVVLEGPDHDEYWDAWHELEQYRYEYKPTGQVYILHLDGDLWMIDETAQVGVDHELWETDD